MNRCFVESFDGCLLVLLALPAGPPLAVAQEQGNAPTNTASWAAPARAARKVNPVPADEKSVTRGRELYTKGCAPCHGAQGRGDGPAAVALNPKPADHTNPKMWVETDGSLFWKITTGRGAMPSHDEAYSDEDRWNLVNFLRTLAPKPAKEDKGDKP